MGRALRGVATQNDPFRLVTRHVDVVDDFNFTDLLAEVKARRQSGAPTN